MREMLVHCTVKIETAIGWTPNAEWVSGLDDDELVDYVVSLARAQGWRAADEAREQS